MRRLHVILLLIFTLSASTTWGQGIGWSTSFNSDFAAMTRLANGDIVVASTIPGGIVVPVVDRFNAGGELISHFQAGGGYGASFGKVLSVELVGDDVHFAASLGYDSATKYTFVAATSTFRAANLMSANLQFEATSFACGDTTYCVTGERSDYKRVIQVRRLSDDVLLREVVTDQDVTTCLHLSRGVFLACGTYFSGTPRLVVHRVTATTNSQSSITAVSGVLSGTTSIVFSKDKATLFIVNSYYNGVTTFNLYARPFKISTLQFQQAYEENASAIETYVRALAPIGTSSAVIIAHNRFIGLNADGSLRFETTLPGTASQEASAVQDASGNAVAILCDLSKDLRVLRLNEAGLVMNSSKVAAYDAVPMGTTIDNAGVLRFIYYPRLPYLRLWHVAAYNQASLDLPGPYTVGGDNLIGTVSIGDPSPVGGATFDLFSNNMAATVPASVTIPEGQSSATFTINTTPVSANAKPLINARYSGIVLQSTFDLAAPLIKSVTATPQSQYGGNNITGAVYLTGKAPTGGKVVTLGSSNTAKATVPASTTLAAGSIGKTFIITTFPTLINASSVITATTGAVSKTVFIAILAPVLLDATLASSSIQGGTTTTMTVTLGSKAPSGYTVTLLSGATSFVQLPSSYSVPAGTTTANIPVLTSSVTTSTPITLVAYRGPYVKVMTLTLTP